MEQEVQVIKMNLKVEHDRHKIYAYQQWVFKEFQVGEHVYLHIKLKRIYLRIGLCAKLTSQFCGPFEILERIGQMAY